MKKYVRSRGFTLVELILVITIIAILSTIGFVSYSGYVGDARDSARVSNLKKLSSALQMYGAKNTLPLPDNSVEITANGKTLLYQGYAGENVLSTIDAQDIVDSQDGDYFTYTIDSSQRKYQIGTMLDTNSSIESANTPQGYYGTLGNPIGVLLTQDGNPIQETVSGQLDIYTTADTYMQVFLGTEYIEGNSTILRAGLGGGGIIGFWDFENSTNSSVGNQLTPQVNGTPQYVTDGVGKSIRFDGSSSMYYNNLQNIGGNRGAPHSISAWLKPDFIPGDCGGSNSCREWILQLGIPGVGTHHWLIGGFHGPSQFGMWGGFQKQPDLQAGQWQHILAVYDGANYMLYQNGKLVGNNSREQNRNELNILNPELHIGGGVQEQDFSGYMDELRIYNRDLDMGDVQNIYQTEKGNFGL